MYDDQTPTDISVKAEAYLFEGKPAHDTQPSLLEGKVLLCGREILYIDESKLVYPQNQMTFDSWGCVGKFEAKNTKQNILPLRTPTEQEFELTFDTDHDYSKFLKKEDLKKADEKPNPIVPHVFRMPYSEDEFESKQYSGNFEVLSKIYEPGQLVRELTAGPILKPATIKRVGDSDAKVEYFTYDEKSNDIKSVIKTVNLDTLKPNQLAGPNMFIDDKIEIPNSIENAEYDMNLNCTVDQDDINDLLFAISIKSNKQFINKLKQFRRLPVRPAAKADFGDTKHITGDLLITIVSARNLSTQYGSGDVYVEIKTYEHNNEEEKFGNFALDDSFQRGKDSMKQMTQVGHMTSSQPLEKNTVFNEEKNMGTFVKGVTHDITFIVKQETNDRDIEIGAASIKSDDFMDPFRPAKE